MSYAFGCDSANEDLDTEVEVNTSKMQTSIYKKIEGKTLADRLREYGKAKDFESIKRVADTESHRVYTDSQYDTAKEVESQSRKSNSNPPDVKSKSYKVKKTWRTMLDDKVRDTHEFLEGVSLDLDERFYTFDGDSSLKPGGFEMAENNINCRCELQLSKVEEKGKQ